MQTGKDPARDPIDRRRLLAGGLLACIPLGAPAFAQDPAPVPAPATDPAALSANLLTRMAAGVGINRGGRGLFVLDTGAEYSAIARDLAERLELPGGPSLIVHGVTAAQITPSVVIRRLDFGGRQFADVVAPVFERSQLAADGLLGLDVLSRFRLLIDLQRLNVRVAPSGPDVLEHGSASSAIPTRLPRGVESGLGRDSQLILTDALVEQVPVKALVDTGAQASIGNLALLRAVGGVGGGAALQVYGVTGQTIQAVSAPVRSIRLARQNLGETPLLFADLHAFSKLGLTDTPALLIGGDILYRFRRIDLDYGRGRMAFGGLRRLQRPSDASNG